MEALKRRVGAFTEGILSMAWPVLLTVALNKVSLNNEGSRTAIGIAIYLAVANLTICLWAFIFLVVADMLKPWNHEKLLDFLYCYSKVLVHVCAILQSVLAYTIVVIKIGFEQSIAHLAFCILFCGFIIFCCIQSAKKTQRQDKDSYAGFHDKLEHSLDILASVTSFLFQMVVAALALESQASNGQDNSGGLIGGFTFILCLVATCFMLAGAVLCPIQFSNDEQRRKKCDMLCMAFSHVWCPTLTFFISVVVVPSMLTELSIGIEFAICMVMIPWFSVGVVYLVCMCKTGRRADSSSEEEAKLAPLGLTKAMFAGFLSLLIPSFSSETVSGSTKAFVVITYMVVISGLLWRLLTHLAPTRAAVVAADAACLQTLVLVMAAGISFVLVAKDAFAQGNITCHSPCTTGQQIQDSILSCFRNTTMTEFHGKHWTAVLSSVTC